MPTTENRYCPKCGKNVSMERCEVCKGAGFTMSLGNKLLCNKACKQKGWKCPNHGYDY